MIFKSKIKHTEKINNQTKQKTKTRKNYEIKKNIT